MQSRSRSNTLEAFRKLVYSDQAPELKNAVTTLGALHRLSTPGMPKTNGLIENKVKLVLHGARVLLRQAGFEPRWWPFAVRHFSMRGILKIEVRDHRGCDATVTGTSAESFCRLVVWSTSTPLLPRFAGIERGGFKTTSDMLGKSTQRTLMREEKPLDRK